MRTRYGVLGVCLLLLVIFLSSCSQQETSQQIDQKGGRLEQGDTAVIFSENAVTEPISVSLKKVDTKSEAPDKAETEGLLSALSILSLNKACDQPVTIRIKLPAGAESKSVKLGLGIRDLTHGKMRINYQFLDTTISGGYAETRFVPSAFAVAASDANTKSVFWNPFSAAVYAEGRNFTVYAGLFESTAWFREGGHFIIHFPGNIPGAELEKFAADLEIQYDHMLALGYRYDKRTVWPLPVYIKSLDYEGQYVESGLRNMATGKSPDHGWIEFNTEYFKEKTYRQTYLRPTIAHEWFHFVQANYTTRGNGSLWIDEATSTYVEWVVSKVVPAPVMLNWSDIFTGAIPPQNTQNAGYARFLFMDYLATTYGESFILETYQDIAKGTNAEIALQNATAAISEWTGPGFAHAFSGRFSTIDPFGQYNGILANQPPASTIGQPFNLVLPDDKTLVQAAQDGKPVDLGNTSVAVKPFGARLLAITLDSRTVSAVNDNMQLTIKVASGIGTGASANQTGAVAAMHLFQCTNAKSALIASNAFSVTTGDLKAMVIQGRKLLLLVTDVTGAGGSIPLKAELVMSPKLEEVIGPYREASMLIEKVYISDAIRKKIIDKNFDAMTNGDFLKQACDAEMLLQLEKLPGTRTPIVLQIEKTGTDTGNLWYENVDPKTTTAKIQKFPFQYVGGNLMLDTAMGEYKVSGSISAAYGDQQNIVLAGRLTYSVVEMEKDLYMDITFNGQKPLTAVP